MVASRGDLRCYALVVATYVAGIGYMATALWGNVGFPLDDSWIHQVVARNLVQFHTWGFTPGVASSGSSSTLWTFVLAIFLKVFPHARPEFWPLVLNAVLLVFSGVVLFYMARKDGLPLAEAVALALIPGVSGNWIWLAFTGMEHVLFVALSLVTIVLWFRQDGTIRPAILAGLALGALDLTRPEGLALCVLLFAIYKYCGRTLADVGRAAGAAAVLIVPAFALNVATSGSLLPTTMRGRRMLVLGTDTLHIGRSTVKMLANNIYERLLEHSYFHSNERWILLFVALAMYGAVRLWMRLPSRTGVLCLWAVVLFACYCCTLPAAGQGGRYQPFVVLLFPPLMAIGLLDIARRVVRRRNAAMEVACVASIWLLTAATLARWNVALRDSVADINGCHRKMAHWIDDHYAPGTKMAVFDIGAIGYFSKIDLVDLGGLVDRRFLPYWISGTVPEYLQEKRVEYVILPHNENDSHFGDMLHLLHNPAVRLVPIHTEGIDAQRWAYGEAYTTNAAQFQTLYRVERVPLQR